MDSPLPRTLVLDLLQAALVAGEARFARQMALAWLAAYPGDLPVALLHAEALVSETQKMPASRRTRSYASPLALLHSICLADPEYLPAQELLAQVLWETRLAASSEIDTSHEVQSKQAGVGAAPAMTSLLDKDADTFGDVLALGGRLQPGAVAPEWAYALRMARQAFWPGEAQETGQKGDRRLRNLSQKVVRQQSTAPAALEAGQRQVHEALLRNPSTPLAAVTHLHFEVGRHLPSPAMHSLAGMYHGRWPGCVQFKLWLAEACMESGEAEMAVQLMHQAVAADVTGQVPRRLWGEVYPYRSLWPERLEAPALKGLAVPASVSAALGWNRLPAGGESPPNSKPLPKEEEISSKSSARAEKHIKHFVPTKESGRVDSPVQATTPDDGLGMSQAPYRKSSIPPETPLSLQAEFERIAARIKQPQLGRMDGRYPVYVIFTTRSGLEAQYGSQAVIRIEEKMLALAEAVRMRGGWGARLFYADEGLVIPGAMCLDGLRQKPARCGDAWSLKLALADLDAALGQAGEMIGAVLLVGGPQVVPFHHLPNPVDDADADVPSDNPYATRDENYFIPEWPVGRLPGGKSADPELLLRALGDYAIRHRRAARRRLFFLRWWEALDWSWLPSLGRLRPSLGYTAEVWKTASQAVFRPAGDGRMLLVSPPVQTGAACKSGNGAQEAVVRRSGDRQAGRVNGNPVCVDLHLHPSRLGYFNLHGLPDTPEWFGQRDPASPLGGPDYPIALHPQDLNPANGKGRAKVPQVVFSEACYGAHILDKDIEEALALKFLASGSQAVAGATCIAYGAIADPLAAADLLGYAFWNYLRQRLPAGEAMRRAKIHLAREMHRRQGYLDGEDQKTLISFVLYGDPLAQPQPVRSRPKTILRPLFPPAQPKTVCDRSTGTRLQGGDVPDESVSYDSISPIPPDVLQAVKSVVAVYLPGMAGAQMRLSQEHAACAGNDHRCPTSQLGAKTRPAHAPHRRVVTLQKNIPALNGKPRQVHQHYARLTLDEGGRLVKLVVSR